MALANLERVSYWYPGGETAALLDVSLEVEAGLTVVTGPSGGGKSTLLRLFNGLIPHFHGGRIAGSVRAGGLDVLTSPTRRMASTVGFVFQDPELQSVYEVVEREVAFGLENLAFPPRDMPDRVRASLAAVGAGHLASRRIRTLSGGERQRVALASVLAMQPRLVVLDEPTSQLDPEGAEAVLAAVRSLTERGVATVVAEHRVEPLVASAGALLSVTEGRVVRTEPAAWTSPPVPGRRTRQSSPGGEVWTLHEVTAAHADAVVFEAATVSGRAGEVVALVGPNGGGKTTLLRLIAGTMRPASGRVERRATRVAYLPQNPASLLHRPTVRAEVRKTLELWGEDDEAADPILRRLGLAHLADLYPGDLSSGQRQRAALATVLAGSPELVLLDEPTRGMDAGARDALIDLVADLRDSGAAVVVATHDSSLRSVLADRELHVRDGRVLEVKGGVTAR